MIEFDVGDLGALLLSRHSTVRRQTTELACLPRSRLKEGQLVCDVYAGPSRQRRRRDQISSSDCVSKSHATSPVLL